MSLSQGWDQKGMEVRHITRNHDPPLPSLPISGLILDEESSLSIFTQKYLVI